jgi:hypothetical protein
VIRELNSLAPLHLIHPSDAVFQYLVPFHITVDDPLDFFLTPSKRLGDFSVREAGATEFCRGSSVTNMLCSSAGFTMATFIAAAMNPPGGKNRQSIPFQ